MDIVSPGSASFGCCVDESHHPPKRPGELGEDVKIGWRVRVDDLHRSSKTPGAVAAIVRT
jgi:hypothetical protein